MYNQYNYRTHYLTSQRSVQTDFKIRHFYLHFSGVVLVWTTSENRAKSLR